MGNQMVALRRLATTAVVCLFVFLALNYHWTHAAFAAIGVKQN